MTKDLVLLIGPEAKSLSTEGFLDKADENLKKAMAKSFSTLNEKGPLTAALFL
jgi:hypothetical protein